MTMLPKNELLAIASSPAVNLQAPILSFCQNKLSLV